MEIAAGLHRLDTSLGSRVVSLYVVVGENESLLFDAGVAGTIPTELVPYLDAQQLPVESIRWVVISHCDVDHFGGIGDVRRHLPWATIVAHDADADAIADYSVYEAQRARGLRVPYGVDEDRDVLAWAREVTDSGPVDIRLRGEMTINLGARTVDVLHVPGHTRGHLALWDSATGSALVSDAVLGSAVPHADGSAAFPPTYRYVHSYRDTIERLGRLMPEWLLTAHYPTYDAAGAAGFLHESAEFADRLEQEVLTVLRRGTVTLAQLLNQIDPTVGNWPQTGTAGALAFPVAGHIEDLIDRGLVRIAGDSNGCALLQAAP